MESVGDVWKMGKGGRQKKKEEIEAEEGVGVLCGAHGTEMS